MEQLPRPRVGLACYSGDTNGTPIQNQQITNKKRHERNRYSGPRPGLAYFSGGKQQVDGKQQKGPHAEMQKETNDHVRSGSEAKPSCWGREDPQPCAGKEQPSPHYKTAPRHNQTLPAKHNTRGKRPGPRR